ncbi:LysM peptidoglycan-binding domain-containing protein [Bifidobacterium cebidarum]|uniref:Peptidoglycan-binding LysM n=1 Tax=Bifidobacterium cebidarum TaxID=2650773 RepID=A0A6I1GLV7_9BIFI|nr:LysM peptidoglycan-binding domain-containing protein [Bifidobacterium cebidarum]KAB7785689.1 Peptidoglycan-binding LysM [Bifidobacterium cebidarum]
MTGSIAMAVIRDSAMDNAAHRRAAVRRNLDSATRVHRVRDNGQRMQARHRGVVMAMIVAVVLTWFAVSVWAVEPAHSDVSATNVTTYTVKPGDTLWAYASSITPQGQDVSETVDELIELNGLESGALRAGQRIVVPDE